MNLLDTPGHKDFSEDTYRPLIAAGAAVMLIDVAKGVEDRTKKLTEVCRYRNIPIFTFINKWNDFINPLIFTNDESMYNMIVGLASILQQRVWLNFGVQMAGTIVTFVPILIVFLFFQQYFTRGIVLSGVKG